MSGLLKNKFKNLKLKVKNEVKNSSFLRVTVVSSGNTISFVMLNAESQNIKLLYFKLFDLSDIYMEHFI